MEKNYHYSGINGESLGPSDVQFDQDGEPIRPSFSTPIPSPSAGKNQAAVFLDESGKPPILAANGTWSVVADFRGDYWLADRSKASITDVGVSLPIEYLSADPGPSLADLRVDQLNKISAACAAAIMAGFTSSALGTPHTYPARMTDQQNLTASVLSSIYPGLAADWTTPFWCADSAGAWAYVSHTAAQIQQVGLDAKSAILAALVRKGALESQINAATTVATVEAIAW